MQVKNFENKAKEEKREQINKIFDDLIEELSELVTFNKIFDEKWLNKSEKLSNIEFEIEEKLNNIRKDLIAIENLNSEFEVEIKNSYLQDFDLAKAINKNNQLLERKKQLLNNKEEELKIISKQEIEDSVSEPILTYTLKITGTLSKQKALKEFLINNEMEFEKL